MKPAIMKLLLLVLVALPAMVQAQFTFTTNNGSITITGYTGTDANIVIPGTINGYPVTSIASNAFYRVGVTITVPSSVTNLANSAFAGVLYVYNLKAVFFLGNAPAGSNAFSWEHPTIYYLSGTTGWGTTFDGIPTQLWSPGAVQLTLTPAWAVTNGAQWEVDGGTWQTNNAVVMGLSAGNHTVSYKIINGWRAPADQIISVGTNFITPIIGNSYYVLPGGPPQTTFQVMHTFIGSDGAHPKSQLIISSNTLFGTTLDGGSMGSGTVFAINTDSTGFTNLVSFTNGGGSYAGLIQSGETLYGTTLGTVFKVNKDGTGFSIICSSNIWNANAGLVLGGNTLYGTTTDGGTHDEGMVFAVNTDGTGFTNLYSFTGQSDGDQPYSGLVLAGDTLYGASFEGVDAGVPFAIKTNGTGFTPFPFHDPYTATMVLSSNTLYGTLLGAVYKVNTDGTGFTNLCYAESWGGVILSGNTLYGTSIEGEIPNKPGQYGYIFAIHTDGTGLTNLHNFAGGSDGSMPWGGLLLSGTTLFGTVTDSGTNSQGTVFLLSFPPPQLTITPSGNNVILTWPSGLTGAGYDSFFVQSATNLMPPVAWSAVAPLPVLVNGLNTVTNPLAGIRQFYRLSQ